MGQWLTNLLLATGKHQKNYFNRCDKHSLSDTPEHTIKYL